MHIIFFSSGGEEFLRWNLLHSPTKNSGTTFLNPKKWIYFSGQQQIKSKSLHQNIFPGQLNCKKPKNCIKCEFFLVLPRLKIYKLNLMQKSFTTMTVPEKMSFVWVHFSWLHKIIKMRWQNKNLWTLFAPSLILTFSYIFFFQFLIKSILKK